MSAFSTHYRHRNTHAYQRAPAAGARFVTWFAKETRRNLTRAHTQGRRRAKRIAMTSATTLQKAAAKKGAPGR